MAPQSGHRVSALCALAGAGTYALGFLRAPAFVQGPAARLASQEKASVGISGVARASSTPAIGMSATGSVAAAATLAAVGTAAMRVRAGKRTALKASPQQVPVLNMDGEQVGEESLDFYTLSKDTANYVVHQVATIWEYQQRDFTPFVKRRSDMKKGRKPYQQKGSGRARHGSRYSPTFWGKAVTNKAPHGFDNKRNKKIDRMQHYRAISTVLQSKWKCMKIIDGLEEWSEARQKKMEKCLASWTDVAPGSKSMLMITRSGFGQLTKRSNIPTPESYDSPLYMSCRLIPKLALRRPRDIDPTSDGLFQTLKGRRVFVSREAFFDLKAKYGREEGWAFKTPRAMLVESLQQLVEEFPMDRAAEIEVARGMPRSGDEREEWAREQRAAMAEDGLLLP